MLLPLALLLLLSLFLLLVFQIHRLGQPFRFSRFSLGYTYHIAKRLTLYGPWNKFHEHLNGLCFIVRIVSDDD